MSYPILVSGEKAGELEIGREGLYTVFEARLPASEELTRLWVAGERQSGYLGLMEPKSGERYLRRRLTAAQMRGMPGTIEYACTEEPVFMEAEPAGQTEPESGAPEEPAEHDSTELSGDSRSTETTGPPADRSPLPASQPEVSREEEHSPGEEKPELLWFSRPDGSLTAFDGVFHLVALPAKLRQATYGVRLMHLGEREYMVFRY